MWQWHARNGHGCWANDELGKFITRFSAFEEIQDEHYRAYKIVEKPRKDHMIWSANNIAIGGKFSTLEVAKAFCESGGD